VLGLEIEETDISNLFVRKSMILCTLGFFQSAKDFAQQAIDITETSVGYYRLAIAQYCLKEYDFALETLLVANDLDGVNFFLQHALQVVLARIRSRKDRPDIIDEDIY
jgi:tetratricopeptide (TPR) repeat protein